MTNQIKISEEIVVSKILYIRGQKVMIDSDLAEMPKGLYFMQLNSSGYQITKKVLID